MAYIVELRYIGGILANAMRDMRIWLDRNRIAPEEFQHSSAPPGVAFRVGFSDQEDAAAFAKAFGGWLAGADPPEAGPHWTIPPRDTCIRSMSRPKLRESALPQRRSSQGNE